MTAIARCVRELLAVERERVEADLVRRADALERVSERLRRFGETAAPGGLLERAAAEAGVAAGWDRVVLSEIVDGRLTPLAMWPDDLDPDAAPVILLAYPLLEHEVPRHQRAQTVDVSRAGGRTPRALAELFGWSSYVVAALAIGGEAVGLLHADRTRSGRAVDGHDAELAEHVAAELSGVLERSVLRHMLELHRAELRAASQWMSARLSRLDDASVVGPPRAGSPGNRAELIDALTPRELDVLRLMARGHTNQAIAEALVVREGTVKYHVKNILRKLGAASRADAVGRFVRAGGGSGGERR